MDQVQAGVIDRGHHVKPTRAAELESAVLDVLGRRVTTLIRGYENVGGLTTRWLPAETSAGTCFVRLATEDGIVTRRVIVG